MRKKRIRTKKSEGGRGKGSTGPKLSATGREVVLEFVATLDMRGESQYEIARRIEVQFDKRLSQQMVSKMLKKIRERYVIMTNVLREEEIAKTVEQYRDIYREAYNAWIKSQSGLERVTTEEQLRITPTLNGDDECKGSSGQGRKGKRQPAIKLEKRLEIVKRQTVTEGRAGGAEYLNIMLACRSAVRDMRGLDAPKRQINMDIPVQQVQWDQFLQMDDPVEERLKAIESGNDNGDLLKDIDTRMNESHGS